MWKALIKLVEKWSHRCDHKWKFIEKEMVLDKKYTHLITGWNSVYRCHKCKDIKKTEYYK